MARVYIFSGQDSCSDSDGVSTNIDWHQSYVPTYVPDGYEISSITDSELSKTIEFTNLQGSLITYMELGAGAKPALDTEHATGFEAVSVNGYEGTIVMKNSLVTIIWAMNDRMFMIRGQIEKDMAIKMAERVKYVN